MEDKNKYNLIVNYYTEKNIERAKELDYCIKENIRNKKMSNVVVICSESDYNSLIGMCEDEFKGKVIPVIYDERPTFNDYFRIASKLFSSPDNINIIANLDILIPEETLFYSHYYLAFGKKCLALTRWDIDELGDFQSFTFFDRADSQDAWFFLGAIPPVPKADFTLGVAGCDNSIAYLLENCGYEVLNPSLTLRTYHLHITQVRNYTDISGQAIKRIPPPYKLITPTI